VAESPSRIQPPSLAILYSRLPSFREEDLIGAYLAPLEGRLTASPTPPAKPIYDHGAHYGTDHGTDNQSPDFHPTSPPTHNINLP
jgi:hypothetical protein